MRIFTNDDPIIETPAQPWTPFVLWILGIIGAIAFLEQQTLIILLICGGVAYSLILFQRAWDTATERACRMEDALTRIEARLGSTLNDGPKSDDAEF